MSFQTIRSAIKTQLDTLVGAGKPFTAAYDYYTAKSDSGYPFVMCEPSADTVQAEYEDTQYNRRVYSFDVTILQEMTEAERQEAVDRIIKGFDAIINLFDKEFTLGGVVKMVAAAGGAIGEADVEGGPFMFATIKLQCTVLHDITI